MSGLSGAGAIAKTETAALAVATVARESMMRITLLIVALASMVATQAFAMDKPAAHAKSTPDWDSCYMLGWYRGVHVELGELPDWMEACLSGQIPFDASEATGTKRAHSHTRTHRAHHS